MHITLSKSKITSEKSSKVQGMLLDTNLKFEKLTTELRDGRLQGYIVVNFNIKIFEII